MSTRRRADDDQPPISCIGNEDAKKFHDLRKISSTPELKYFGLGSLSSLRRDIAGTTGNPYRDHERLKSMHIAQIAPLTEAIPPKLYGGTERVVSWLTEELIALGHEVTLFARGDSQTSAKRPSARRRGARSQRAAHDDAGARLSALERFRRPAFSSGLLSVLAVRPPGDAVRHHAARPARFARASAGVRPL